VQGVCGWVFQVPGGLSGKIISLQLLSFFMASSTAKEFSIPMAEAIVEVSLF
jgi:hypothetical protein